MDGSHARHLGVKGALASFRKPTCEDEPIISAQVFEAVDPRSPPITFYNAILPPITTRQQAV